MDFAERLRALRLEKGMSQEELGKVLHLAKQTISSYENRASHPSPEIEDRIVAYFGVSLDYLRGQSNIRNIKTLQFIPTGKVRFVPILKTLRIGPLDRAEDNIEGWREVPEERMEEGKDYFYWRAKDDAMSPQVRTGNLILAREEPRVEDGKGTVVIVRGEELLRRLYSEGDTVVLKADNPEYPPIIVKRSEVHTVGPIVGVWSEFK